MDKQELLLWALMKAEMLNARNEKLGLLPSPTRADLYELYEIKGALRVLHELTQKLNG